MISGINHITLAVRNIEASFAFYQDVLGFQPLARWPVGAYFLAGDMWLALVVDPSARDAPLPEYTHIAFTVEPERFDAMARRIVESGARLWQEDHTEGDSLYFTDPNGHKLEIHASDLETRLRTAKAHPWTGLEFLV